MGGLLTARTLFIVAASIICLPGRAFAEVCPVSVSGLALEGKSADHHAFRYRLLLSTSEADAKTVTGADISFSVRGQRPITESIDGLKFLSGIGADFVKVVFDRASEDILNAGITSVRSNGVPEPTCYTKPIPVGTAGADEVDAELTTAIITLPNPSPGTVPSPALRTGPGSEWSMKEADFTYQAVLNYPELAKEQGIYGTTIVDVQIGLDGKLARMWVSESSGSRLLDNAALSAAVSSKYKSALFNDVPFAHDYKIIYEFRLGGAPTSAFDSSELLEACPAFVNDASLLAVFGDGPMYWYSVSLGRSAAVLADVSLTIDSSPMHQSILHWTNLASATRDDGKPYFDDGALYALGAPITAVSVTAVSNSYPALPTTCKLQPQGALNPVSPLGLVEFAKTDKPWLTAMELQTVRSVHFATPVWPSYPAAALAQQKGAVLTDVDVRTLPSGIPIAAFVDDSSIAPAFAQAALDAAMASTYVIPLGPDGRPLTESFYVEYVYEPPT